MHFPLFLKTLVFECPSFLCYLTTSFQILKTKCNIWINFVNTTKVKPWRRVHHVGHGHPLGSLLIGQYCSVCTISKSLLLQHNPTSIPIERFWTEYRTNVCMKIQKIHLPRHVSVEFVDFLKPCLFGAQNSQTGGLSFVIWLFTPKILGS